MKKLSVLFFLCCCVFLWAQVPPLLRGPWTTNTPGSINAFATNTTVITNLHVKGPTDSLLLQVNTNQFAVTNKNAILGPLGVFGQGKEYGTPTDNFSGYVQPYNDGDGYTRIWNTGPFGIFFATDNTLRMRLDSPGNLSIGFSGAYYGNGIGLSNLLASNVISGGQLPLGTVSTGLSSVAGPFLTTNGASRSYSFNGGLITNVASTSIVNLGNIVFQNGPATNITLWGSSGGTNFTATTTNGWLNTNLTTKGYVSISSGNITANGAIQGSYGSATCATGQVTVATSSSTNLFTSWSYTSFLGAIGMETNSNFVTTNAAFYRISMGARIGGINGDTVRLLLFTNSVQCTLISLAFTCTAQALNETGFKELVISLPANCRVSMRVSNNNANNTTVDNACFNIGGAN